MDVFGAERGSLWQFLRFVFTKDPQANGLLVDPSSANELDRVLDAKPEDGFIAVTFSHPRGAGQSSLEGVSYKDSRVLALMSRGTAEAILKSATYRRRLLACLRGGDLDACGHTNRYVLAVVESM